MEYSVGQTGRVIAARLFEGEDLYESIEQIAQKEQIRCAAVLITGGFRKADVVVGPKQEEPRIEADFRSGDGLLRVSLNAYDAVDPSAPVTIGVPAERCVVVAGTP